MLCNPNANAPHTFQQWFVTSCFQAIPTTGTGVANVVGNAGRGIINGPPTKRFDLSFFKNIYFGGEQRVKLQLRGEIFNIFNHTNFRAIASLSNASTVFGAIGTVRDPRTVQIGAKLSF